MKIFASKNDRDFVQTEREKQEKNLVENLIKGKILEEKFSPESKIPEEKLLLESKISEEKFSHESKILEEKFQPIHQEEIKPEAIFSENISPNFELSDEEIAQILIEILRYGCLSLSQIQKILKKSISPIHLESSLEGVEVGSEKVYFHTEKSLEQVTLWNKKAKTNFPQAVFARQFSYENLLDILQEIDILMSIEKMKTCCIFDWVSAENPRKKSSLKISGVQGNRKTCKPNLLVMIKAKEEKKCFLFDFLPCYDAHTPGEQLYHYRKIISAYQAWLSDQESIKQWREKLETKFENIEVVLIFPEKNQRIIADLSPEPGSENQNFLIHYVTMRDIPKRLF